MNIINQIIKYLIFISSYNKFTQVNYKHTISKILNNIVNIKKIYKKNSLSYIKIL